MSANASAKIHKRKDNDLTDIITQALNKMKETQRRNFNINKINLAELERHTDISRAKLGRIKADGFVDGSHALTGRKAEITLLTGFTGIIDNLLRCGITNSLSATTALRETTTRTAEQL